MLSNYLFSKFLHMHSYMHIFSLLFSTFYQNYHQGYNDLCYSQQIEI